MNNCTRCVPLGTLTSIAQSLARRLSLPAPSLKQVSGAYVEGVYPSQPLVLSGENGTLWVDRYYAAYQDRDGLLRYAYISKKHVSEEVNAWRAANRALPPDVEAAMRPAVKKMRMSGTAFWLDSALAPPLRSARSR